MSNGTGGVKTDQGKLRWDLLPLAMLEGVVRILQAKAPEVGEFNWAKGLDYTRLLNATKRHLTKIDLGKDIDPDFGELHVDHALCNLLFLSWYMKHPEVYSKFDDRHLLED